MHTTAPVRRSLKIVRTAAGATMLAVLLIAQAGPVRAQDGAITAGLGLSIPRGTAGERYGFGPAGRLSVEVQRGSRLAFRLDAEWSRMPGGILEFYPEDLLTYGGSLNALWRFRGSRYVPYLLLGAGGYRLQRMGDDPSVYGTTPALQAGVGLEAWYRATMAVVVEMRTVAHLTDYAAEEFTPSIFWPVMAGLRWQLPE
jgi:hypothetical protein